MVFSTQRTQTMVEWLETKSNYANQLEKISLLSIGTIRNLGLDNICKTSLKTQKSHYRHKWSTATFFFFFFYDIQKRHNRAITIGLLQCFEKHSHMLLLSGVQKLRKCHKIFSDALQIITPIATFQKRRKSICHLAF